MVKLMKSSEAVNIPKRFNTFGLHGTPHFFTIDIWGEIKSELAKGSRDHDN